MAGWVTFQILCSIGNGALAEPGRVIPKPAGLHDPAPIDLDFGSRVRLLLSAWEIDDPNVPMLDRTWLDAFDGSPTGVSVRRLMQIAQDCSSRYYKVADGVEAWCQRLSFRLNADLHLPASYTNPGEPSQEDELDLQGIGREWPTELLVGDAFRFIPSLLPELPGLPLEGTWVELQFVDVRPTSLTTAQSWPAQREERSLQNLKRSTDLQSVLQQLTGTMFIIGDPGSGKSTLVNWIAREAIRDARFPFLLPLLVRLREYGIKRSGGGLLAHALRRSGVATDSQVSLWTSALNRMAKHDRQSVILLLDGLDELPRSDASLRQQILEEIEELGRHFCVIVTARPAAVTPEVSRRSRACRITDLSPAASDRLLENWCHSAKMMPNQINGLIAQINANPDLQRMGRNPFLLTCLCSIAATSTSGTLSLPFERAEIYKRCLEVIKKQHYPKQTREFVATDMRQLGRLAYWLLRDAPEAPRLVFDRGDVEEACGDKTFFEEVVEPSRLVSQWDIGDSTLFFSHATFHEFLAADHLLAPGQREKYVNVLRERRFDRRWVEVFAFLGAREVSTTGPFWEHAWKIAQHQDRFGGVYLLLAHWLREARVRDGGVALLAGVNIIDELWKRIFTGIDPKRFMTACANLAPEEFAQRFEQAKALGQVGSLHREFLRVLKQSPLPRFSDLFVEEILDPLNGGGGLPQEHRLTADSLRRLRLALETGAHDETVSRRAIQALGLSRDHKSLPLLERLASATGPLQSTAVEAIGLIGGLEAFSLLDRRLKAATNGEWSLLVDGLGNMREERATARLLRELALLRIDDPRSVEVLCALQDHAVSPDGALTILDFLRSPLTETRSYAACVLQEAAPSPTISGALSQVARTDVEDEVREAALLSLERHAQATDFDWLEAIVRNESGEFEITGREAALLAIGGMTTPRGSDTDRLLALLDYGLTQPGLEKTAINIWGDLGPEFAQPLLDVCKKFLANTAAAEGPLEAIVVEEACRVLGEIKHAESVDTLHEIVSRHGLFHRIRESAARALTLTAPERLLDDSSEVSRRILGQFSLETGRLVFDDYVLDDTGTSPRDTATSFETNQRTVWLQFIAGDRGGDQQQLLLPREEKAIKAAVKRSPLKLLDSIHAASISDLLECTQREAEIVHFAGHGRDRQLRLLRDRDYVIEYTALSVEDLERLFRNFPRRVRLAVFNTCNSLALATHLTNQNVVDVAIGVEKLLSDTDARYFASEFYEFLADGKSIKSAHEFASFELSGAETTGRPQLREAPGIDASQVFFVLQTPAK